MNTHLYTYCLRIADNALINGQRLSELCSKAPFLEEDLALTNMALDMIGRAQLILKYAAEVEGKGRTEDDLAFRRAEHEYLNNLIAELPNGNFADTIARQFYLASFESLFFEELCKSKNETLSAIAEKAIKEVRYHLEHTSDWIIRLGDGTELSRKRMQKALDETWTFTDELFEMDETDTVLMQQGVAVDLSQLKDKWRRIVADVLTEATLEVPGSIFMQKGGKQGRHTETLGHLLSEMQYLQRTYPDAKW